MDSFGLWSLFPTLVVLVMAIVTRRTIESLMTGALISASAFGSHACFYGDSTVLSAQGSGCTPMAHALTQLPYALIAAGLATLVFLAAGYP